MTPTRRKAQPAAPPPLCTAMLCPGMRLGVAVSGGADSVALLRALAAEQTRLGLVLSVLHVHHGIRGTAADNDARFAEELAGALGLRFLRRDVDTPAEAAAARANLEETARTLRYTWFAQLLAAGTCDAIATGHTLNDQAETVLHRLLRGAWTEGLGGIHPRIPPTGSSRPPASTPPQAPRQPGGILRPLLGATRAQITLWLTTLGQPWCEDATNADLALTRNRIRHQLLPELATYNPAITTQLAQLAALARDEEDYWEHEVSRLLPALLLPGKAVRRGGRANSTLPGERALALEVERMRGLHPALFRRILRGAARELGVALDFKETAQLLALAQARGAATPRREQLTAELRAERTPRELRLQWTAAAAKAAHPRPSLPAAAIDFPVPGEVTGMGWRLRCRLTGSQPAGYTAPRATLRAARPGDRVRLRHSRGAPKRIKEVLERLGIPAADRAGWPVLEYGGEIVWMAGALLEPGPLGVEAEQLA